MVGTAYAFRYRDDVRALGYGEASQPGTGYFERMKNSAHEWHFSFHQHSPLEPDADLIQSRQPENRRLKRLLRVSV